MTRRPIPKKKAHSEVWWAVKGIHGFHPSGFTTNRLDARLAAGQIHGWEEKKPKIVRVSIQELPAKKKPTTRKGRN